MADIPNTLENSDLYFDPTKTLEKKKKKRKHHGNIETAIDQFFDKMQHSEEKSHKKKKKRKKRDEDEIYEGKENENVNIVKKTKKNTHNEEIERMDFNENNINYKRGSKSKKKYNRKSVDINENENLSGCDPFEMETEDTKLLNQTDANEIETLEFNEYEVKKRKKRKKESITDTAELDLIPNLKDTTTENYTFVDINENENLSGCDPFEMETEDTKLLNQTDANEIETLEFNEYEVKKRKKRKKESITDTAELDLIHNLEDTITENYTPCENRKDKKKKKRSKSLCESEEPKEYQALSPKQQNGILEFEDSNIDDKMEEVQTMSSRKKRNIPKLHHVIPYMSEKNKNMLLDLDIDIDFEIPKLHESKIRLTKKSGYNTKPFTTSEIEQIKKNYENLFKGVEDPDPRAIIYMSRRVIHFNRMKAILQILGKGLNDRSLHQIQCNFSKIYNSHKTGHFSKEEMKILCEHIQEKRPINELVEKLNRSLKSIQQNHKKAIFQIESKGVADEEYLNYTKEDIVRLIMERANVDNLSDLKNVNYSRGFFYPIALKLKLTPEALMYKWNYHIYVELFAKDRNIMKIKKKLIKLLIKDEVEDLKRINLTHYADQLEGTTNVFISNLLKGIKKQIDLDKNVLDELKKLLENCICSKCSLPDIKRGIIEHLELNQSLEKPKKKKKKKKKHNDS